MDELDWSDVQCPPFGPKDARIVLIGEAPGEHEVLQRQPFVGASGRLLDQMLRAVGIDRASCYLTNVVKNRPPGNDFGHFYERNKKGQLDVRRAKPTANLLSSIERLHKELEHLTPNIIILLGNEPLRAVTNLRGIEKWRGSLLATRFGKVLPTIHPAAILRSYGDRPVVELDLQRASVESTRRDLQIPSMDFILRPDIRAVRRWFSQPHDRVAFDIETLKGSDGVSHVRCIALSSSKNTAICIPFISRRHTGLIGGDDTHTSYCSYWTIEEEYEVLALLNKLFLNESIEKIAQNYPFDSTMLATEFGFDICGTLQDTMLAHHVCYPELPKSLDFLCSIYTRIPYYSDYDSKDDYSTWRYNSYDAAVTLEVWEVVEAELREAKLLEFYSLHVIPTMLAMTRAQNRGVLVDENERAKQKAEYAEKIKNAVVSLRAISGKEGLNPSSTKQMRDLLYTDLGLSPQKHHKTKNVTVGKDALESLAKKHPEHKELFDTLRRHSSDETLHDGFLSKELGSDGRIRTSYNVAGTVTGRLSSSESFLYPSTNLQNIQKPGSGPMRRCFISGPKRLILKADLSQAEFRIVVWLAKIERLIREYKENVNFDVHTWVASLIFKKEQKDVTKPERDIAKNGVYGGNYSMQPLTASRTYKLDFRTAKFVLEEYRRVIPEIPSWWESVKTEVSNTRKLTSPFGRQRVFFGRIDDELFRSAYSHSAQTIVGDLINRAAVLADEFFDANECPLLMQVHDELVFEPLETEALRYAGYLKSLMEYPLKFPDVDEPLTIPADVSLGKNWYDQEKVSV